LNFEVAGSLPIFSKRFLRLSTVRLKFLMATSSNSSVGYIESGGRLEIPADGPKRELTIVLPEV